MREKETERELEREREGEKEGGRDKGDSEKEVKPLRGKNSISFSSKPQTMKSTCKLSLYR